MVEETSKEADYEKFRERLLSAKSKDKAGKEVIGPRYAVYDVEFDAPGDAGKRYVTSLRCGHSDGQEERASQLDFALSFEGIAVSNMEATGNPRQ